MVLDKRIKTWNFFYWDAGKRRSKKTGTLRQYPTKASAWRAAKALRDAVESHVKVSSNAPKVSTLIEQYRAEKMPTRHDTTRGEVTNLGFAFTSCRSGEITRSQTYKHDLSNCGWNL